MTFKNINEMAYAPSAEEKHINFMMQIFLAGKGIKDKTKAYDCTSNCLYGKCLPYARLINGIFENTELISINKEFNDMIRIIWRRNYCS